MNSTNHITANDNYRQVPTTFVRTITPSDAKRLLENNTLNRNINERLVSAMARDMANGSWVFNGESIKISNTGRLLDGQHRLSACVRAGIPFETVVIEGLPESAMDTVDAGRKRTAGDVLKMHGYNNNNNLAAAARTILDYEDHGLRPAIANSSAYSNSEILAFIDKNPEVTDICKRATQFNSVTGGLMTPSTAALVYYMFTRVDRTAADRFFDLLQTGAGLDELNPILKLRNYLIAIRTVHAGRRITNFKVTVLAMKCWNKWRTGQPIVSLRFSENEQIPELI